MIPPSFLGTLIINYSAHDMCNEQLRRPGGGGGGGTLIFSHIRRLGPFFWGKNSEFRYIWGFSEKIFFFFGGGGGGGMKILWIFLGGHHKI